MTTLPNHQKQASMNLLKLQNLLKTFLFLIKFQKDKKYFMHVNWNQLRNIGPVDVSLCKWTAIVEIALKLVSLKLSSIFVKYPVSEYWDMYLTFGQGYCDALQNARNKSAKEFKSYIFFRKLCGVKVWFFRKLLSTLRDISRSPQPVL